MALGGGGSATITGYEALYVNPANLFIREKNYRLQLSLLQSGGTVDALSRVHSPTDRLRLFESHLLPYKTLDEGQRLDHDLRNEIIDRNFPGRRRAVAQQSYSDIHWFGLKWYGEDRAYALGLRSRHYSNFELGRGYFSNSTIESNGEQLLDRSFRHQYQTLHELSFGFAESFTFLNGLTSGLNQFIVGIAPKVVLAGSYLNSEYRNTYSYREENNTWLRDHQFTEHTSGTFSDQSRIHYNNNRIDFVGGSFNELMNPSGIGFGLDVGITYLITFGSDLSVILRDNVPTEKSLRISFSITDLGAVHHFRDAEKSQYEARMDEITRLPSLSNYSFTGAPGEHLFFLNHLEDSPLDEPAENQSRSIQALLPAAMHAGALFQINRVKLMGDFSMPIAGNQFASKAPVFYVGAELRPLSFLPLRAGTRLAPHLPGYYSFGFGIDTRYFEINTAVQLRSSRIGPTEELMGVSLTGIKLYFP
jgi:hypothetical protein